MKRFRAGISVCFAGGASRFFLRHVSAHAANPDIAGARAAVPQATAFTQTALCGFRKVIPPEFPRILRALMYV
jgi:hypothetical protein